MKLTATLRDKKGWTKKTVIHGKPPRYIKIPTLGIDYVFEIYTVKPLVYKEVEMDIN